MPFPSTGCRTCKIRRIKCDEAQPACQRCVKSHRLCSRTGGGPIIHTENPYASGHYKRPRGPRSNFTLSCNFDAVLQRPSADLKTLATWHYLHNHLRAPGEALSASKSVADGFLPIWNSAPQCPAILDLAVASIALAVFSRTQMYPPAAIEASTTYHQLLRIAQRTVPSMDQESIDAWLLAIFFMGRYENVVHHPDGHPNSEVPFATALRSFSHNDGAMAILKLWRDRLSRSQPATDVIKHTRRGIIKSALLRNRAVPDWMVEGTLFGEHGLELEFDRIVVQIANIRQRLSVLLKEDSGQNLTTPELIAAAKMQSKEVENIDKALRNWTALSTSWCYQRHTLEDWQAGGSYSPTIYSYPSLEYAAVCIQYHSVIMLVNSTRLKIFNLICPNPNEFQRLECLSRIYSVADDLASSLPFCLQKIQITKSPGVSSYQFSATLNEDEGVKPAMAELTVWPLTIASSLGDLVEKQRLWFRAQLASVGRMIGDKVLELDEADRWLQL